MPAQTDSHKTLFRQAVRVSIVCCLVTAIASGASAQTVTRTSASRDDRQNLYKELDDEYTQLYKFLGLLKKVVRLTTPTVVHIEARKPVESRSGYRRRPLEEAGSGIVIELENKFYILTNRHVIADAPLEEIKIRFDDGRVANPKNVWSDRSTDVAVMSVEETGLVAARVGDSDPTEIGDFVVAVGSPFGLSHSVTYGIISAKGRRDLKLGDGSIKYQDFLQTDAAINPGNSGGPLLNLRGEVIGINTAIASSSGGSEGIGFTIPINMAMMVAQQLVTDGRPTRAYLGVKLYRHNAFTFEMAARLGLPRPYGALVRDITEGSPADKAEIQPHDVIVRFDGRPIEDDDHLIKVVGFTEVGKEVDVVVLRDARPVTLTITLVDRSRFEAD